MSKKFKTAENEPLEEVLNKETEASKAKKKEASKATENGRKRAKKKSKSSREEKLKQKNEEMEQQLAELKDKYIRLLAEFDNYKKRTIKEKIDLMRNAAQDTLTSLLPVLDDFDRAKKIADDETSSEQFSEGVSLVYQKLYAALLQKGLHPMETNGEAFDPEFHEAITEIAAPSKDLKGKIIDTIEKGYKLNDKIIRHAKVVVGK